MSVFDGLGSTLSSAAKGAGSLFTSATNGASDVLSKAGGAITGATTDLVQDIGGEVLGSVGDSGGILGTLAGALGGVFDTFAARQTWGRLNPKLLAQLYACDKEGNMVETGYVAGPISDDNLEIGLNWQSPFENSGPETKVPSIMALLQSGQAATVINALQVSGVLGTSEELNTIADNAKRAAAALEGRTGITKVNSRQVFSGMPPVKVSMTLHLRAMVDTQSELMAQYERLLSWSLPQQLAEDSYLTGIIRQGGDVTEMVKALFPSEAPRMVSLNYGPLAFPPMVVEHVSHPLSAPQAKNGQWVYLPVQVTLATLTAMDRQDLVYFFR